MRLRELPPHVNDLSFEVISAAIEVHSTLQRGMMEHAYRDCMAHELRLRGHRAEVEVELPLQYKGLLVPRAFRADLIVDDIILVELKCVDALDAKHEAQLLTYLAASGLPLGMLLNFKAPRLMEDFRRVALTTSR